VFRCRMFLGAAAFNQNIGGWNTAKVSDMYSGCHDCMCKLVDFGNLQGSNNRLLARRGATKCLREDRVGRQHGE
jgi:surface protein